uniref:Uncharacterized protein n=1 Tax=Ixodes ricinus TaxID=34613 RepID=A0A6B0V1G8_IXORI
MGGQTRLDSRPSMVPTLRDKKGSTRRNSAGVKKRIVAASELKSLAALQDWVQPIMKQLCWCAELREGAPDEILSKWTSLAGHVARIHNHANPIYPGYQHGDLGRRKWLPEVCLDHQPSASTQGVLGEAAALGGKAGLRSSWGNTQRGGDKASERSSGCVGCRGVCSTLERQLNKQGESMRCRPRGSTAVNQQAERRKCRMGGAA